MIVLIFLIFFYTIFPHPIRAISDPFSVPNNKFGIHIADTGDLRDAAKLVNSNGGDWGYVTLVIQDGDRNIGKWQEVMNTMRRLHLIPIVRLATHPEGDAWKIPQVDDAPRWAEFLNSLNWPTQNRYIVLFNEPNHSKEWGNTINPEEYADISYTYGKTLKDISEDFFILPAGLDSSASSDGNALDAQVYLKRMYEKKPEFFELLDGLTSHSYPNPGFSGTPYAIGRGTLNSFEWELSFLAALGIKKSLPVFITETGWIHNQALFGARGRLTPSDIGNYLRLASLGPWSSKRIVAITPFVLSYQSFPFDNFSWKKLGGSDFYDHYQAYQNISKIKGEPIQRESYQFSESLIPDKLIINSDYSLKSQLKNTGQGIMDPKGDYTLDIKDTTNGFTFMPKSLPLLEPNETGTVELDMKTPRTEGNYSLTLSILHNKRVVYSVQIELRLIPPPNMTINTRVGWKKENELKEVTILVYDSSDMLLHKFPKLTLRDGSVTITGLYNMIPGKPYRVVLLAPYYLPRQQTVMFSEENNTIQLKRLFPLDFNNDGTFTMSDLPSLLFTKPNEVLSRFF